MGAFSIAATVTARSLHDGLHRTSLPIPCAKGVYPPKPLIPILGGPLTFESDWTPGLGSSFQQALAKDTGESRLDVGCVAAHGHFIFDTGTNTHQFVEGKPATAFLFKLIAQLQFSGTVPMIDVDAYAKARQVKPWPRSSSHDASPDSLQRGRALPYVQLSR
jgi:hypothetical protein